MSVAVAPFGQTCGLRKAVIGTSGTATECPSPRDWQTGEAAMASTYANGYIIPAVYHNRSGSMNCWSRAQTAGLVQ